MPYNLGKVAVFLKVTVVANHGTMDCNLHILIGKLTINVILVPGFERVALLAVDWDREVHNLHLILSIIVKGKPNPYSNQERYVFVSCDLVYTGPSKDIKIRSIPSIEKNE